MHVIKRDWDSTLSGSIHCYIYNRDVPFKSSLVGCPNSLLNNRKRTVPINCGLWYQMPLSAIQHRPSNDKAEQTRRILPIVLSHVREIVCKTAIWDILCKNKCHEPIIQNHEKTLTETLSLQIWWNFTWTIMTRSSHNISNAMPAKFGTWVNLWNKEQREFPQIS